MQSIENIKNYNPELILSISKNISQNGVFFYNNLFKDNNLNFVYKSIAVCSLDKFRDSFYYLNVYGVSIASPYKEEIIKFVDELTPSARYTNSVNCLKKIDNAILGHNTDVEGLIEIFKINHSLFKKDCKILIYGSGGVVPSIIYAIKKVFPDPSISIIGRNQEKIKKLSSKYFINQVTSPTTEYDCFINATPLENSVNAFELSKSSAIVFDLNPIQNEYELERLVTQRGQLFIRGFDFYLLQLVNQFKFYTGFEISIRDLNKLVERRNKVV